MNKNRTAKVNIEQIGIDEDVLFNLMTHDAKYDFYALRPDEVTELQNSIKAIIDDRDRLRAQAKWNASAMGRILNDRDRLRATNAALLEACIAAYDWMIWLKDDMVAEGERDALEKLSAVIDAAFDKTEPE